MSELVSIIIPTYNREKTIVRAIRSVLGQTYKNIEIIVVDDCSTDNTISVVNSEFGNDKRVILHKLEQNSGACAARNKGVELSNGQYIGFLDSDDEYLLNKIEKQLSLIKESGAQLCASDYIYKEEDGKEMTVKTYPGNQREVYERLLYCNFITTGTLIGLRECFTETPFDESLPRYQDWDLALRLCQKYSICFLTDSTLIQYCQPQSISKATSHNKTLTALETIYEKNATGYQNNRLAYTQINWLMGLHSMFIPGKKDFKKLWIGVVHNGFSFRRFCIFIASASGFIKFIDKKL